MFVQFFAFLRAAKAKQTQFFTLSDEGGTQRKNGASSGLLTHFMGSSRLFQGPDGEILDQIWGCVKD